MRRNLMAANASCVRHSSGTAAQTDREATMSCDTADRRRDHSRRKLKPIRIRQSRYLNNCIEQDHRAIKRRERLMVGFQSMNSARAILGGIERVHMIRKGQVECARNLCFSPAAE